MAQIPSMKRFVKQRCLALNLSDEISDGFGYSSQKYEKRFVHCALESL